jgi:rubredoxin
MVTTGRWGAAIKESKQCPAARRKALFTIASFYSQGKYAVTYTKTWMCLICGWIYDEVLGAPDDGIAAGTLWADVPMNWTCPECGARKEDFEMVQI